MNFVKTEPGADPIIVEAQFSASPSQVFQAWTDPEQVRKWFGANPGGPVAVAIDLRPGGVWRFTEKADERCSVGFEGHYIEIEQDRLLIFSWSKFTDRGTGQQAIADRSQVEIRLKQSDHGTLMRITHSAIPDHEERIGFCSGWEGGTAKLIELLQEG